MPFTLGCFGVGGWVLGLVNSVLLGFLSATGFNRLPSIIRKMGQDGHVVLARTLSRCSP